MRKVALALLLGAVSVSTFAQSSNISILTKSTNDWQPLAITDKSGIVTITMNEAQVTPELYDFVAMWGICSPLWLDSKNKTFLKTTKEIRILNKFNYSGYIFENPHSACNEAGKVEEDQAKVIILSHTHLATRSDLK